MSRPRIPRLHVVTDDAVLSREDFEAEARAVLVAGGAGLALHLRGAAVTGRKLHRLATELSREAAGTGALLLVNDRVDVVLTTRAHGAHLAGRSLPVEAARALLGPERLLGRSTHARDEALAAAGEGADYLFVGTIFPTPSHPGVAGRGPEAVGEVAEAVRVPVLGIGGITPERVVEVTTRGAHGVAVIRGVWGDARPAEAVARYLAAMETEER